MGSERMKEAENGEKPPRKHNANSLAHMSGCSSIALWLVVGIVGTYILYGTLVGITSTDPIHALK
ncbi:MAG: hypothetical protein OSA98_22735 [Rubripirellula sp.]|nr:hypothetical protein [Rubripirellula sp.]